MKGGDNMAKKKQSLRIQISFKEKYDDLEVYNWILSSSSMVGISGFIKSILKEAMLEEQNKNAIEN